MLTRDLSLRAPKATLLAMVLAVAVLVALLAKVAAAWSAQQGLKAELLALSSSSATSAAASGPTINTDKEHLNELQRLVTVGAAQAATRQEAHARSTPIAESFEPGSPATNGAERSTAVVSTPNLAAIDARTRVSIDDIVARAKLAEIEVATAQADGALSGDDRQVISVSVKGAYSGIRSWLIDVTDADPHLLLSMLQFRREHRGQPRVAAEIKFVRIETLAPR